MSKIKLLFIGLLSLALVFGMALTSCGDTPEQWKEPDVDPPTLTNASRIDGQTFTRGTPKTNASEAIAGSAELRSSEVNADEEATYAKTNPTIELRTSPPSATLKYAKTQSLTDVPATTAYSATKPGSLSNNDFLWVQVTEQNVSNYYVIKITVKYSPVSVFAIAGDPASRQSTLNDWTDDPIPLTVAMQETYDGYRYQWYSKANANAAGVLIPNATDASYTPTTITANGDYYFYVVVSISGETAADDDETVTSKTALIRIAATVDPAPTQFTIGSDRVNYIRGVGGTGSFMFRTGGNADASPDADVNYIDLLCGTLGANILRIMVQDDYLNYIENEVQSPSNQNQFRHDAKKNFFPVIRRVNEAGGYVFANPWTGPQYLKNLDNTIAYPGYWLKSSSEGGTTQKSSADGGFLRLTGQAYTDYATHFRNFLTWLNDNDAPIFALGILNEPDNGGGAAYEGMGMSGNTTRDWFRTVGHFTTQYVADRDTAQTGVRGVLIDDIIPGYGGGGETHHVLTMTPDPMGSNNFDRISPAVQDSGENGASNVIELIGCHLYSGANRYTVAAGANGTLWNARPQLNYKGPYEDESLEMSPQMYAPGSVATQIKREVWQTEHDFNYSSASVVAPNDVSKHWNSAFALMNDIDWALCVAGYSVFDWWFSSSYSGMVTSYHAVHGGPKDGTNPNPERTWGPYQITPRGRAFAHYGRYINETWLLPITRDRGSVTTWNNSSSFNAGTTTPSIRAYEDVNGKFVSIVMFTPSTSTANGQIGPGFGGGGTSGNSDPTRGSTNVGKIAVVLPIGFVASSATALRSYGNDNSTGAAYDAGVPTGSPRYWIDEPVFLSTDEGKSIVEVTLPGGNIISIKVMGTWPGRDVADPERPRPYERYQNGYMSGPIMVEGMNPPPNR